MPPCELLRRIDQVLREDREDDGRHWHRRSGRPGSSADQEPIDRPTKGRARRARGRVPPLKKSVSYAELLRVLPVRRRRIAP